ncbi:MAG: YXWGXW repeat-containing protein [Bradyrhizobium sp.]|nr:YXWGXW repeat-containing protein [Bradyrhizobium sp.]
MKLLRSSIVALMLGAALPAYLGGPARAQISIDVSVEIAPPPLPYYEQPIIPAEGYIWVPGYWAWDANEGDYYWVPGTWVEPPQPELLWTPAYWGWIGGRYAFHPGYWGREVGFYGGIDYGFGYTGDGYYGGHWDHGAFFYNRTVNNITNVRITNVYNQTVVVNNTVNRVSFNGGNGGTTARPTAQQEAFARERHVEETPVQRQHVEAASKDRALFAKQNHGEPAVAATAHPGVMRGEGVTRASRTPIVPAAAPEHEPGRQEQPPRPPPEPPRATEPGREPPRAEEKTPAEESRRPPQEGPKAEEPHRPPSEAPKTEAPRPVEPAREPPKLEPRAEPKPEPRAEPKPEPRVEERRPNPPEVARPPAAKEPPRMAPPPRPPAQHPPGHEEERK